LALIFLLIFLFKSTARLDEGGSWLKVC